MPTTRRKRTHHSKRKRRRANLTKGQLNKIVDVLLHRHFGKNPGLIFLDGLAHFIVEKDPEKSFRKFLKYGVPALFKETRRKKRRRRNK